MKTTASPGPSTRLEPPRPAAARLAADAVQHWLAALAVVGCCLQVVFAALGFWGANAHPGNEAAARAAFEPHAVTGEMLGVLAIALLICGVIAHSNRKAWILPLVAAVLLEAVQGPLVGLGFGVSRYFGGLHALDGMVITALLVWLAYDRWQHRLGRRG